MYPCSVVIAAGRGGEDRGGGGRSVIARPGSVVHGGAARPSSGESTHTGKSPP